MFSPPVGPMVFTQLSEESDKTPEINKEKQEALDFTKGEKLDYSFNTDNSEIIVEIESSEQI